MTTSRSFTIVAIGALALGGNALASDKFSFPSSSGLQLSAHPAPTFVQSTVDASFASGGTHTDIRREAPPPPPEYVSGRDNGSAYLLMSAALNTASYANYVADYARLFEPGHAVSAWTDRVFGVIDTGYSAVDAWTGATYDMRRLPGGPRRETAPDLSVMPPLRPHPELDQSPQFTRQSQ